MTKEMTRKWLAAAAVMSALMIGAGGTIAYLTDNESHTNTFTVGDVKIDLTEEEWDETDKDRDGVPDAAEDLVPGQEIGKDPMIVKAADKSDAIVFMRVTVPVRDVTPVSDDGKAGSHAMQEIFWLKLKNDAFSSHKNHFGANWILLKETQGTDEKGAGQKTYVFGYQNPLTEEKPETTKLFEKVQIKNMIENEVFSEELQNIKVEAFAIQADNVLAEGAAEAVIGKADLAKVYDIFVAQNGTIDDQGNMVWNRVQDDAHGQTEKEADTNNDRDLKSAKRTGNAAAGGTGSEKP